MHNQFRKPVWELTVSSCFSTFLFFLLFSFLLFFFVLFDSGARTSVSCEDEEEMSIGTLWWALVQARSIAFSTIFKLRSSLASSSSSLPLLSTIGDFVGLNCSCSFSPSSSSWRNVAAFRFFSLLPIGVRDEEESCRSETGRRKPRFIKRTAWNPKPL